MILLGILLLPRPIAGIPSRLVPRFLTHVHSSTSVRLVVRSNGRSPAACVLGNHTMMVETKVERQWLS